MRKKQQRLLNFIFFLSILGIILSGYLTYIHYSTLNSPCDFSETFQCSLVNRSKYAEIFSIPVALLGIIGYSFLGFISLSLAKDNLLTKIRKKKIINKIISAKTLLFFSIMALITSLYLTYAEFFIIKAICILCVFSQITILGITFSSYKNLKLEKSIRGDLEL
ncbi:vitamin K epoxide reductase family protein [Candidatus Woesearchaeota archaeon]|jgi:uncharacterized membrane protein|nr:vitamin K epoxide reductase family protein [Candidatus Woesearchaeota archaeon]